MLEIQSLLWNQAAVRSPDGGQTEICRRWMLHTNPKPLLSPSSLIPSSRAGLTTAAAPVTQQLADGWLAVVYTWSSQPNDTCARHKL